MAKQPPVVYLVYGEDEFSISKFATEIENKLGDPTSKMLGTTHFEGASLSLDDLENAVKALPFLTSRRLVVVTDPLARLNNPALQKKFTSILEQMPPTSALVLLVFREFEAYKKKYKKEHWLLRWARSAGESVYIRPFNLKKGDVLAKWIQDQAIEAGGKFTPQAAALLASLVGEDTRLAYQEIQKLLTYTNYKRPVEPDDVEMLTAFAGQVDIFVLVDALGNLDGKQAVTMLRRLQETGDVLSIFGMVVRQFRLLLQAREILDNGGQVSDVTKQVGLHPFVAGKITAQARNFSLPTLEFVYHKLLDVDESIKTGLMEGDTALDTFVAAFTARPL
jgi:DNA polymerase-3 subunit delta